MRFSEFLGVLFIMMKLKWVEVGMVRKSLFIHQKTPLDFKMIKIKISKAITFSLLRAGGLSRVFLDSETPKITFLCWVGCYF